MPKVEVPEHLTCPITWCLFEEPVVAEDGYTYEKAAIEDWVTSNANSPKTGKPMRKGWIVDLKKKAEILHFLKKNQLCTVREFWIAVKSGIVSLLANLNYGHNYFYAREYWNKWGFKTPLHFAVIENDVEMAKFLLAEGANVEMKDGWEDTPLHSACGHLCEEEMITLLLDEKANIEAKDRAGATPLHELVESCYVGVAHLFFERKANLEAKDDEGRTPLHAAAQDDHFEMAWLLLNEGADKEAKDNEGRTALHWATWKNHVSIVKLLVSEEANWEARDNNNLTALHYALVHEDMKVAKIILEAVCRQLFMIKRGMIVLSFLFLLGIQL